MLAGKQAEAKMEHILNKGGLFFETVKFLQLLCCNTNCKVATSFQEYKL